MTAPSVLPLLAIAGLAAAASAQIITTPGITATFSLSWIEDPAFVHNDNGVLEPGEHALIRTSFSFTGQYQRVNFSPPIAQFASGVLTGFGSAYIDIRSTSINPTGLYNNGITVPPSTSVGPDADAGGTAGYGVRAPFRIGGDVANGTPFSGGFINVGPGQFVNAPAAVDQTNPITNMDRVGWAPSSYATRTVNFGVNAAVGEGNTVGLLLDLDGTTDGTHAGYVPGTLIGFGYVPDIRVTFGSVNIPIAPAPAGLALLAVAGLATCRRDRNAAGESP